MIPAEQSHREPTAEFRSLLTAYLAGMSPADDGWFDRLSEAPGVEAEMLSRVHGQLIAHGLLDFRLSDRSGGLQYQVTTLGKQALHGAPPPAEDEEDAPEPVPQGAQAA